MYMLYTLEFIIIGIILSFAKLSNLDFFRFIRIRFIPEISGYLFTFKGKIPHMQILHSYLAACCNTYYIRNYIRKET